MVDSDPFIEIDAVDDLSHLSDITRRRLERRQRFPKRIKLSTRRSVYRRSEIEAWVRDPEAWRPAMACAEAAS
ncbi:MULTISPECIES: helix-turn-helix transcriptional regulator [Bradyrhizobium]|uniref:helix-turn-helix transcriptional regulator n=1 Tax=Bradyrhizobium elkanii TaxID=29448 RepID=UPI002714F65E|nr:AlpA family phage regulatory protein [Bradyrhizobium elkanii]WLA47308.1 AlpA family phage regulatory protein [Bradyrhizobium elkanii]WLB82396.1 AlpA family phage regulatory protein [Bradyrhizobium elkanii]